MIDINMIETTIKDLENQETTFLTCQKLASLYTVRDNIKNSTDVESELSDILPMYREYCDKKRRYQMGEISLTVVDNAMKSVCKEITEFLLILYNNTESQQERDDFGIAIMNVVDSIFQIVK